MFFRNSNGIRNEVGGPCGVGRVDKEDHVDIKRLLWTAWDQVPQNCKN